MATLPPKLEDFNRKKASRGRKLPDINDTAFVIVTDSSPTTVQEQIGLPLRYACRRPGCSNHYAGQSHRNRHEKTSHDGALVSAPCCQQKFSRSDNMSQHMKICGKRKREETNVTGPIHSPSRSYRPVPASRKRKATPITPRAESSQQAGSRSRPSIQALDDDSVPPPKKKQKKASNDHHNDATNNDATLQPRRRHKRTGHVEYPYSSILHLSPSPAPVPPPIMVSQLPVWATVSPRPGSQAEHATAPSHYSVIDGSSLVDSFDRAQFTVNSILSQDSRLTVLRVPDSEVTRTETRAISGLYTSPVTYPSQPTLNREASHLSYPDILEAWRALDNVGIPSHPLHSEESDRLDASHSNTLSERMTSTCVHALTNMPHSSYGAPLTPMSAAMRPPMLLPSLLSPAWHSFSAVDPRPEMLTSYNFGAPPTYPSPSASTPGNPSFLDSYTSVELSD